MNPSQPRISLKEFTCEVELEDRLFVQVTLAGFFYFLYHFMSVYDQGLSNRAIYVYNYVSMMYSFGPAKSVVMAD